MSTDVKALYQYRTFKNDSQSEPDMHVNRRRAASKLVTYVHQGHNVDAMRAEVKVGGKWQHDPQAFTTMRTKLEKEAASGKTSVNPLSAKRVAGQLASALKIASSADTIEDLHVSTITDLYNRFIEAYHSELDGAETIEDEDEDEE